MRNESTAQTKTLVDLDPAANAGATVNYVWCPHCGGVTTITDIGGEVEEGALVFRGKGVRCG